MSWISQKDIDRWFTYRAPAPGAWQVEQVRAVRAAAKELAEVILANTPGSGDQSAAIRLVREAMWTANAAILCANEKEITPLAITPEEKYSLAARAFLNQE